MNASLSRAFVCVVLSCLTVCAQKQPEYHTGRLLTVSYEIVSDAAEDAYLLHIRDGANEYFALYKVKLLFRHNRSDLLKPDTDVQYRISGKSLFVKTPDSKEIKSGLCERGTFTFAAKFGSAQPVVKCGGVLFLGKDVAPLDEANPSDANP
jgi:hypothetical protein